MKRTESGRPSDDESIAATAAAWIAQRDDSFTAAQAESFARWRAADPRHEAAAIRLEGAWTKLLPLREFRPSAVRHPDRDLLAAPARRRAGAFPLRPFAWAAAAAAAILLAAGWWALRPVRPDPALYATTSGGYERVMLPDGSVLELNGSTATEVRFDAAARRVRLARGEAHFTVVKDRARPFWVEAGDVAVRAVGTAFNVRLESGAVEVLVTEGRVAVATSGGLSGDTLPALSSAPGDSVASAGGLRAELGANERLVLPRSHHPSAAGSAPVVERLSPEVIREALGWQALRLVFIDTPLSEVADQFNRRNRVQLVLADPELASLPVGGSFRAENVEAFVRLLESGGDVTVDRTEAMRLVLRRTK